MVVAILLILLFVLLLGFLVMPINLCVDTIKNQYYVQLQGVAKACIVEHEEEMVQIRLRAFFRNFYFYPLRSENTLKKKKNAPKKVKKSRGRIGFHRAMRLMKSFKIKKFSMDVDTGNCILNAKLYPVFAFLKFYKGDFNINFEGRNHMVLYLQNRPIYILKSFINI